MITKYEKYCMICGRPTTTVHHCIFGNAKRKLADEDKLTMPVCDYHHNLGGFESIHNNVSAAALSKIIGQLWFMLLDTTDETQRQQSIERFRKRYGKSYI